MHQIIENINSVLVLFINKIGYLGIFIGMFLESTLVPIPSEVIMIPAGLAAAQGSFNLFWVIFLGILGNVLGAIFSYYLAIYAGRAILFRIGKYFFIKPEAITKIENYFNAHGEISVFVGRLLVGFRHFISLPAGIARMNIYKFCFYTTLGSTIWTSVLALLGYFIGKNQDLIEQYLAIIAICVVAFCASVIVVYVFVKRYKAFKK